MMEYNLKLPDWQTDKSPTDWLADAAYQVALIGVEIEEVQRIIKDAYDKGRQEYLNLNPEMIE